MRRMEVRLCRVENMLSSGMSEEQQELLKAWEAVKLPDSPIPYPEVDLAEGDSLSVPFLLEDRFYS